MIIQKKLSSLFPCKHNFKTCLGFSEVQYCLRENPMSFEMIWLIIIISFILSCIIISWWSWQIRTWGIQAILPKISLWVVRFIFGSRRSCCTCRVRPRSVRRSTRGRFYTPHIVALSTRQRWSAKRCTLLTSQSQSSCSV